MRLNEYHKQALEEAKAAGVSESGLEEMTRQYESFGCCNIATLNEEDKSKIKIDEDVDYNTLDWIGC